MTPDDLAPGRVLHFNEASWDRLQAVLRAHHLDLMAEHVAERRSKNVLVLDLRDGDAEELRDYLLGTDMRMSVGDRSRIVGQIVAQTKPPRIPEPGLWGVVEASCVHGDTRTRWVRDSLGWASVDHEVIRTHNHDGWDDLIDPVLVREGVGE